MDTPTKSITVLTGTLGVWLTTFPFIVKPPSLDTWNDVVVGGTIATLAGYNYSRERIQGGPGKGISGILVLFGGWLLLAPFITGVAGGLLWNDVVVGVFVTAFAGYNVYVAPSGEQTVTHVPTNDTESLATTDSQDTIQTLFAHTDGVRKQRGVS
ncbi:SPW repeat protein [Halobacterium sp. R2-5]|uniref:SPW repeat protein n=1 Tax=Halobacterium sp. R2-5 TaxID=2715751 RepID=UPI0014215B5A|nr:SPW repeat protein [Halobacterium sp. R2-5]NIC01053.1 SPW repeat protein [Halobacterium sp. R2-5]